MKTPAVFFDKDGTLIPDIPYNVDPRLIRLEEQAAYGLRLLAQANFRFVVVSNQSGVARGLFEESALENVAAAINDWMQKAAGTALAGFYYCPHHPQGCEPAYAVECNCRKPRPGMLLRAADELGIDLSQSWMVGDILDDIEAGRRAGCRTILIDNGHETEWLPGPLRQPHFVVPNINEAAAIILHASSTNLAHPAADVPSADWQNGLGEK